LLKQIAAILLLSVLLFNWIGYRLLTAYWEERAAARMEATLEADRYDPAQLILVRIPADALPYSNSSAKFQRSDGCIEVGAKRYRIVKRRLYNDSIEFLCLPDRASTLARSSRDNFFLLVNDLQKPGHSKFPGGSGKTNPPVNKMVWLDTHQFPNLHYFAARQVLPPRSPKLGLPTGHSRIGLLPPRKDNSLS
jgi:hypothetical protein